jgi:hypothetical protein
VRDRRAAPDAALIGAFVARCRGDCDVPLHRTTETVVNIHELAFSPASPLPTLPAPAEAPTGVPPRQPAPLAEEAGGSTVFPEALPLPPDPAAPVPAGARPAVADPAADLLAGLGRRFRGPTLRMSFELRTSIARQIFRRDFVYVSQQLHALEASRRVQGLPRESLNEALAAIGQRVDEVRAQLRDSTAHTRDLIELHGHSGADVEFTRPATLQATIVSPYARDFMDVLVHADQALTQLERAWLLGLLEPAEKGRMSGECRKAVQSVKETVREQRQWIGAQVREVNARRGPVEFAAPEGAPEGEPAPGSPLGGDPVAA